MAIRPNFFCHNSETFSLSVREDANENKVFQKVHLFPKCSSGHIESSFDKPLRKFLTNARTFSNQCRKTFKIIYSFRERSIPSGPNCSSRRRKGRYGNSADEIQTESKSVSAWTRKRFVQCRNKIKLQLNFVKKKNRFLQNVPMDT